jgi:hypothetical protein
MKSLEALVIDEDSFFDVMKELVVNSNNQVVILPPSSDSSQILLDVQVSTRSILGSLIYHTGGVLIDHGWIRILGSGHKSLPRDVKSWNENSNGSGIYLIADDAAGGFFAINGGAFSGEVNSVYYWSSDSMEWEDLEVKYSDFFGWLLNCDLNEFYEGLRWEGWENDIQKISTDQCVAFYPFLWTEEGDCNNSKRAVVPVKEALELKYDLLSQLQSIT